MFCFVAFYYCVGINAFIEKDCIIKVIPVARVLSFEILGLERYLSVGINFEVVRKQNSCFSCVPANWCFTTRVQSFLVILHCCAHTQGNNMISYTMDKIGRDEVPPSSPLSQIGQDKTSRPTPQPPPPKLDKTGVPQIGHN